VTKLFLLNMIKNIYAFFLLGFLAFLTSCSNKENEQLRAENDSLRNELNNRHALMMTMRDIKVLMDSIDFNRKALHVNLYEGTTYQEFTDRMQDINKYVVKTEQKLTALEDDLKQSKGESSAYMMMVAALKDELSIRADEIETLEKDVVTYKTENKGLIKTVGLQQNQLTDMHRKIDIKQQELSLLEAKVTELVDNFQVSEKEAYFARAQAVEEAANRTKLAPHKKRETYKEALELYQKAHALGKTEASEKIASLEKRIR